jgi:membrane-bound lytic murein transglycosylase MltF
LVVINEQIKDIHTLDDLTGRMIFVRSGSSYITHLKKLKQQLIAKGLAPFHIKEADQHIVTEDILELVNAGAIPITVADHHIAEAWSHVLPHIVVRTDLPINTGGQIAWAVRRENPELRTSLNTYVKKNKLGSLLGNILFNRYYKDSKWIKNPLAAKERQKLEIFMALFQKFADHYGFDALAIAAQAYQESGFDHHKKSSSGAVGIMQIMPKTATDKSVNIPDIHLLENNIHAGVKYLNFLRNRYFSDPAIEPAARVDFSWAAYNAGPAKIIRLRQKAKRRGFDPDKWFFHVEKIAAEMIGRETVEYVANINKYYVAYKLYFESQKQRTKRLQ